MVLAAGRQLRDAVLQQNALNPNDATCSAGKQSALLDLVLAIYDASLAALDRGLPAAAIEELDLSAVARVRDEVGPDDVAGVAQVRSAMLAAVAGLQ